MLHVLMRPVADGNKLFLWHEVLALIARSLVPEGNALKRLSRVRGVSHNFNCPLQGPGRVQVLEGRMQPVTFSAE